MDEYIKKSEAIKAIVEHPSNIGVFTGKAIRAIENLPAEDVAPKSELSDEEYETAAQKAYNELMRSLDEAGGGIRELVSEKMRLIYALKSTVGWLNYFLAHNRDDIYYNKADEARCCAEYLLMDLECTE